MATQKVENMTLGELKKAEEKLQKRLGKLQDKRAQKVAELDQIDAEIAEITGQKTEKRSAKKNAPSRKSSGKKRGRRSGKGGGPTLPEVMATVLKRAGKELPVTDIVDRASKALHGDGEAPKTFKSMVAQQLSTNDQFERVERGVYRLAEQTEPEATQSEDQNADAEAEEAQEETAPAEA